MNEKMLTYLEKYISEKPDWVLELEKFAHEHHVPIMESVGIDFLLNQIKIHQPETILEVGTAIGYSALRMLSANPKAFITTIEKDEERYQQATEYIHQFGKTANIDILFGDALEVMKDLHDMQRTFDLIFIDAAKGKYQEFYNLAHPMLNDGGLLITDNVLFRGYVAQPEDAPKRFKNMVRKIDEYNRFMSSNQDYVTSIFPIGDGVMLSYKKRLKGGRE